VRVLLLVLEEAGKSRQVRGLQGFWGLWGRLGFGLRALGRFWSCAQLLIRLSKSEHNNLLLFRHLLRRTNNSRLRGLVRLPKSALHLGFFLLRLLRWAAVRILVVSF
jgi:hypothetical protein